jgi:hypothetical protein
VFGGGYWAGSNPVSVNKDANIRVPAKPVSGQIRVGSCKVTTIMSVLDVLASQAQSHIHTLVREDVERTALAQGFKQAIEVYGCSVAEISASTGWTPDAIRQAIDRLVPDDSLSALDGSH